MTDLKIIMRIARTDLAEVTRAEQPCQDHAEGDGAEAVAVGIVIVDVAIERPDAKARRKWL